MQDEDAKKPITIFSSVKVNVAGSGNCIWDNQQTDDDRHNALFGKSLTTKPKLC